MVILQVFLALGAFGIIGFVIYWFGVALKSGPESTKEAINKDKRI